MRPETTSRALRETIYALASGPARAGIAVVRVSGPAAGQALWALAGRDAPPRRAVRATLADPATSEPIDDGLVLWFPAPASYTGEDVAEFHIHGGRSTVAALAESLRRLPGLRPAEAGEFSRRAFDNGKLDLTSAEGLADLVAAETDAQRRQALRQMRGALGALYDGWRTTLLHALAHLEAAIDFPDEDLPAGLVSGVQQSVLGILDSMTQHLDDSGRGERLRDGASIAIIGPPNVGKSSLLNALARRDAAIVAELPGTTRDAIEVHMDLAGYPAALVDTAGLREASDPVEQEGVRRAVARAEQADIRLVLIEAPHAGRLETAQRDWIGRGALPVLTKIDLPGVNGVREVAGRPAYRVSSVTGEGLGALEAALARSVRETLEPGEAPALTRARHRAALEACAESLRRAAAQDAVDLMAEDLRLATRALGRITGRVDVEEILDLVFKEFCIGK